MQKLLLKLLTILLVFYTHLAVTAHAQTYTLIRADSLFDNGLLEQAKALYLKEWTENKRYSPRMLLKLGYIEEQAGDIPLALYYYNQFLDLTHNTQIIPKIQELSEQHHLKGYDFSDVEYFFSLYRRYHYAIIFTILLIGLPYFIYLVVRALQKKKWGSRPLGFLAILGVVFLLNNYDVIPDRAIVMEQTCLMSGPSAGAPCVESITPGNRLTVLGSEGTIWYRVLWENRTLYIRDKNIKIIRDSGQ
jgi:tetratricopeptide (TPR) repeat protein